MRVRWGMSFILLALNLADMRYLQRVSHHHYFQSPQTCPIVASYYLLQP